ncbi:MAG: hypothetical protein EOP86_04915 [Verrucomicrobiaceae bacterium]|nr:MAG: hypothetical protein EOP86_04915 [Verrucomicrobiaceae bacterium]
MGIPGQPVLAYWQLSPVVEHDPSEVIEHASKLRTAGYRINLDQLRERTGYELEEVAEAEPEEGQEQGDKAEKDGDDPLNNRAGDRMEDATDSPQDAARRRVATALNEDFEGVRTLLEQLDATPPDSPDYIDLLTRAQRAIDLLASAKPGTLKADAAFAELAAEGLLDGWSSNPEQP